jgi:hypothetical protein
MYHHELPAAVVRTNTSLHRTAHHYVTSQVAAATYWHGNQRAMAHSSLSFSRQYCCEPTRTFFFKILSQLFSKFWRE